jgi:hypothetical protein
MLRNEWRRKRDDRCQCKGNTGSKANVNIGHRTIRSAVSHTRAMRDAHRVACVVAAKTLRADFVRRGERLDANRVGPSGQEDR